MQTRELDELVAENQRILDSMHHEVAIGTRDVADARIERYRRLFAYVGQPDERAAAAAELHRRVYQANRRCVEGALELVTMLARAAARRRDQQQHRRRAAGEARHLRLRADGRTALVTSEEVGVAKPDPRIFHIALERLRMRAARSGDDRRRLGAGHRRRHRCGHPRAVAQSQRACRIPIRRVAMQITALHPAEDVAALVAPDHALLNRTL